MLNNAIRKEAGSSGFWTARLTHLQAHHLLYLLMVPQKLVQKKNTIQ